MENKLKKLLEEYQDLPEYMDRVLSDVNQISAFGDRPIHVAAVRGNIEELLLLYENGADINAKGEYGYTPLLHAVEQGHIDAVKWLIEKGVDTSIRDQTGGSALDTAELLGHEKIQELLKNAKS